MTTPDNEPAFLLALASAGVDDRQVDSPEYLAIRYANPPTNGTLERIVKLHSYIAEHEGEKITQTELAEAVEIDQSSVSRIMKNYPTLFIKDAIGYRVGLLPQSFVDAYRNSEQPEVLMTGPTKFERETTRDIKKILSIVSLMNEESKPVETDTSASGGFNTSRPYLDDAIIGKLYNNPTVRRLDIFYREEFDTHQRLTLMYQLMYALDKELPEVMRIVSESMNKAK